MKRVVGRGFTVFFGLEEVCRCFEIAKSLFGVDRALTLEVCGVVV